jgi:hypothetical protein
MPTRRYTVSAKYYRIPTAVCRQSLHIGRSNEQSADFRQNYGKRSQSTTVLRVFGGEGRVGTQYSDFLVQNRVLQLSRYVILKRLPSYLEEVKIFLAEKGLEYTELTNRQ